MAERAAGFVVFAGEPEDVVLVEDAPDGAKALWKPKSRPPTSPGDPRRDPSVNPCVGSLFLQEKFLEKV
jgi:hypothetical protein